MRGSLIALYLCVACGAQQRPDPALATADLAQALTAADIDALVALTGRSRASVETAESSSAAELHALGIAVAHAPVEVGSRVTSADGSVVMLVREDGAWRVDRGVLGRPALARPQDAVLALHDALARSRMFAVTSLMARTQRDELQTELRRWIDATADPDALDVSVQGESAIARTPTGEVIELVRESGEWRVLDLR